MAYLVPFLIEKLKHPIWHVRYWTAWKLGAVDSPEATNALEALVEALSDAEPRVRTAAGNSLVRILSRWPSKANSVATVPTLIKLLGDNGSLLTEIPLSARRQIWTQQQFDATELILRDALENWIRETGSSPLLARFTIFARRLQALDAVRNGAPTVGGTSIVVKPAP
jgi:hypothetical protein